MVGKKSEKLKKTVGFVKDDIWRITDEEVSKSRSIWYKVIKIVSISTQRYVKDRMVNKASALTYSTLLSMVPILALLFAIARGFGFSNILETQLRTTMSGQSSTLTIILPYIDSYLQNTKQGIFIGIGLLLLLWTVLNLTNNIEKTFNQIWQVKKPRSPFRKLTDYFAIFLLLPILMVISGGLSIFMTTMLKSMKDFQLMASFTKFLIQLIPYVYTGIMFTALYVFMPNTRVKLKNAVIPGFIAGAAFQALQIFYIFSQLWVSRYNAIYGSFAAIPLFLLWTQISWSICLYGAELSYAIQNIRNFSFAYDIEHVSRRYHDFLCLLIMSLICKRFAKGESPYNADELAKENHIPYRLTHEILYDLQDIKMILPLTEDEKSDAVFYIPAEDINHMSVSLLQNRLDLYGSEDFKIDKKLFSSQWEVLENAREEYYSYADKILLKDL